MNLADKILKLRKELGLSQEAFAEKLGVSRQSVSKWESNGALPDIDKIVTMSKLFGVSTDFLLNDGECDTEVQPPAPVEEQENFSEKESDVKMPDGKNKKPFKKIIAAVLAMCILAAAICIPAYYGSIMEAWWELCGGKVKYSYVLVHGLGGWGEGDGINGVSQYWGATACNLTEYLTEQGYEVHAPSVGPVSSAWDRACELYAQLTGTTVDYGEAHSKEHNHERFGREYTEPLVEGWGTRINGGQLIKINLVGHSFGGATVRLLASLLEYGSEAERELSGGEVSPLFEGGKGKWVHSLTTLCAPHNGSSLTCVLDSVGGLVGIEDTTELLATVCFAVAGVADPADGVYDFKLDQFGISGVDPEQAIEAITASGNDHAAYDLSPDGAAKLNETIQTVDDIYYLSYAYSTTKQGTLLKGQVPDSSTLPILSPFALAMGSYTGTTKGGIAIDESWQENDGLVSVVSAKYPFDEAYVDMPAVSNEMEKGIWNVAPTTRGDHGNVIGLNSDEETTKSFFINLFTMIDSLKR